jgi:hypothetical protein
LTFAIAKLRRFVSFFALKLLARGFFGRGFAPGPSFAFDVRPRASARTPAPA